MGISWAYLGHIWGISGAYLVHILGRSFGEAAKLSKEDKEVCDHHTTKDEEEEGGLYLRHMGGATCWSADRSQGCREWHGRRASPLGSPAPQCFRNACFEENWTPNISQNARFNRLVHLSGGSLA